MDVAFKSFVFCFALIALIGLGHWLANSQRFEHWFRSGKPRRRKFDIRSMSRKERRSLALAKDLYRQNQFVEAAALLERIGLQREAVSMLENAGKIEEAATLLKKMDRPNRAGVIYARYGQWQKALDCFLAAKMPLEVGRCARELGDLPLATTQFLLARHFAEAAECLQQTGNYLDSARNFVKANFERKAVALYQKAFEETGDLASVKLEATDLLFLVDQCVRGQAPIVFVDILDLHKKLPEAVVGLLRYSNIDEAAKFIQRSKDKLLDAVCQRIKGHESLMRAFASAYERLSYFCEAAQVYEQLNDLFLAETAYNHAQLPNEAARCRSLRTEKNSTPIREGSKISFATSDDEPTVMMPPKNHHTKNSSLALDADTESFLRRVRIFADLTPSERATVFGITKTIIILPDQKLVQKGQVPEGLYIIKQGSVRVENSANIPHLEQKISKYDYFGHEWVFFDELSSEDVTTATETHFLVLDKLALNKLMDNNQTLAKKFYKTLLRQARFEDVIRQNDSAFSKAS